MQEYHSERDWSTVGGKSAADAVLMVLDDTHIRAQLLYFGQYALVRKGPGGVVYLPLVECS